MSGKTLSVLIVCTGNICRSPTGEGVMRHLAKERGLAERVRIASAGTHDYHVGESPDARSIQHASKRGYDLSAQRAAQVMREDFNEHDYILAMDRGHLRALARLQPPGSRAKLGLFLEASGRWKDEDVPDPYYGGAAGFEEVLDMVEEAAGRWLDRFEMELKPGGFRLQGVAMMEKHMAKIYVIHENDAWVEPLRAAFAEQGLPYEEWFLDKGVLDFSSKPPQGVFYNRMSASSHTRDHRFAAEYTSCVLPWLELHGRRVVNASKALRLEINKIAQYAELARAGVRTPRTLAAIGPEKIVDAARKMQGSFITKHNRAGKGLGVRLFHSLESSKSYVHSPVFEDSVDGVTLVQEYIKAPEPFITRVELIGGELLYAVRVDTTLGFELCPADVCEIGDAMCPVGEKPSAAAPRFEILPNFNHPVVERYKKVLAANDVEVAGVEFIADERGELYTYDINTNTNYNSAAEERAGKFGMRAVAAFLGRELRGLERIGAAAD